VFGRATYHVERETVKVDADQAKGS
jgi:hypothetical protein